MKNIKRKYYFIVCVGILLIIVSWSQNLPADTKMLKIVDRKGAIIADLPENDYIHGKLLGMQYLNALRKTPPDLDEAKELKAQAQEIENQLLTEEEGDERAAEFYKGWLEGGGSPYENKEMNHAKLQSSKKEKKTNI